MKAGEKHTPTPWKTGGSSIYEVGGEGRRITTAVVQAVKKAEAEANAAFIVRAVNAHDDLLSACRLAADWEAGEDVGPMTSDRVLATLRTTIAKANG